MSSDLTGQVFGERSGTAQRYVDLLLSRGIDRGLIGPREADRIWERHLLNSVALASLIPQGAEVMDVGSGAGLPGIPLSVARPDLRMTLLEPLLRRSTFLDEVVAELGLSDRVRVVRGRAEDHHDTYDIVVARAVAPLGRLIIWCSPLVAPGGATLAMKGSRAEIEVTEARSVLDSHGLSAEILEVRAHPEAEATRVVRVRAKPRS